MRRIASVLLLAGLVSMPLVARAATPPGPTVDVVEIAGIIDRPIAEYAIQQIQSAEQHHDALVVFEIDSLGGLKISDSQPLPPLVRRIADARVPIAIHIGPRAARAEGLILYMAEAANIASIGPSARIGPPHPIDFGHANVSKSEELQTLRALAQARGRSITTDEFNVLGANEAVHAGYFDLVTPSVANLLESLDGKTVTTAAGPVTLHLPSNETIIRFSQPGPIKRLLHTFANPTLVYIMLIAGALLVVFELFQPGFGVAGVTGGVLLLATAYGLTVLPARWFGLLALCIGLVLLTVDVALDAIAIPTVTGTAAFITGSLLLYPNNSEPVRISPWLVGFAAAAALIVFIPVMTVVRRARKPIAAEVKAELVGEGGEVRSVLNPEGFVLVDGELWRARSEDGSRMRVGEPVTVSRIDGTVLIVRATFSGNGAH
ncbi:MAG TPA: NfeD family protein [Actinomycetota bacterium]|nr:NfeD family protein [Actinomycetota bacterium]